LSPGKKGGALSSASERTFQILSTPRHTKTEASPFSIRREGTDSFEGFDHSRPARRKFVAWVKDTGDGKKASAGFGGERKKNRTVDNR